MPRYLVNYDLHRPEKDYPKLIGTLKGIKAVRILKSTWRVDDPRTCHDLTQYLLEFVDADDSLYVCQLGKDATCSAWHNTLEDEWLHING